MIGEEKNPGLIPYVLSDVFEFKNKQVNNPFFFIVIVKFFLI